jgi:hypothetical protein
MPEATSAADQAGNRHRGTLAVDERFLAHADEKISIPKPLDRLLDIRYRAQRDLGVERVDHAWDEPVEDISSKQMMQCCQRKEEESNGSLRFDRMLSHDRVEIVFQLVLRRANVTHTARLVSGSTGTTENLYVSARCHAAHKSRLT